MRVRISVARFSHRGDLEDCRECGVVHAPEITRPVSCGSGSCLLYTQIRYSVNVRGGCVGGTMPKLVGVSEIAELAGMTRQAVTNLRARDSAFPVPVADLRSGPVFREDDVRVYLKERGREVVAPSQLQHRRETLRFDPLDIDNLMLSVARTLMSEPLYYFDDLPEFGGGGLLAVYYDGGFEPYAPISGTDTPLYVGGAALSRAGVSGRRTDSRVLFQRLRRHGKSLMEIVGHEFGLRDFRCRFLVVDDIWIAPTQQLLVTMHRPLWNTVLTGFGANEQGSTARMSRPSRWSELHSQRSTTTDRPRLMNRDQLLERVRAHLSGDAEPQP